MHKKRINKIIGLVILAIFLCSSFSALVKHTNNKDIQDLKILYPTTIYGGNLRVYIGEPISRQNDYDGNPYHYGFLDLLIDEKLSVEYKETYNKQVTWNAQQAGYDNIEEDNIILVLVIFNPKGHIKFAFPPLSHPFKEYYVDAATAATPGTNGENTVNVNFTHSFFC